MYSPSRAHSPVHALRSRPPKNYRRYFFSITSRQLRLHPIFFIPIFFLGTLFSPFTNNNNNSVGEPVYRKEDYDFKPELVFAKPDAPPLILQDGDGDDDSIVERRGRGRGRVLARTRHGKGADESEWWDPSSSSSDDSYSYLFQQSQGLLYFPTSQNTIPLINSQFPLPPPRTVRKPASNPPTTSPPPPPSDWLSPGDIFKSPLEYRRQTRLDDAPLPPARKPNQPQQVQQPQRRVPLAQRIPASEKEALKRKIGQNAQKAQWAKKQGQPFKPSKPEELIQLELNRKKELEKKRKEEQNQRFRNAVWAEVVPVVVEKDSNGKVLGVDDDEEEEDEESREEEEEEEELSDLEILKAVRELSVEERKLLSKEEQQVIKELEIKYPQPPQEEEPPTKVKEGGGEKRVNFRERAAKGAFNPLIPGGGGGGRAAGRAAVGQVQAQQAARRRGPGLRKRSTEEEQAAEEEEVDSAASSSSSVFPDLPHPITLLIEQAEEKWESMLLRQSQTLEQAVEEYTLRYGYSPPVGFDSWWRFAMENRIILVDEYDQIHQDMLPFRSLTPSEFRKRSKQLQTDQTLPWWNYSFGLGIKTGTVKKYGQGGGGNDNDNGRIEDLMDILGEFAEMMPEDVELRFMSGDEPGVVVSGEAKDRHEEYAREGKFLSTSQALETLEPTGYTPWDSLCSPNSTARRRAQALPTDSLRIKTMTNYKTLINLEHSKSMDLCLHPELKSINGFTSSTSSGGPRPYLLYPMFSFTKTLLHSDLLVPFISNDFYVETGKDPTWEGKKHNKVLWRGETTGAWHSKGSGWRNTHRARLVALANSPSTEESTLHVSSSSLPDSDFLRRTTAPQSSLTSHYLDVAYSGGGPVQCSSTIYDQTCTELTKDETLRFDNMKMMTSEEENDYKYVLDVDANYSSGKFKRYLSSRSLVFKSSIFPEWWSKRIMPWYHYVPIKSDYSDLLDVSAYFIGLPDGTGSHDLLAKKLAQRGQKWSLEHWREVDMAAYMFRLYLEYARLLHRDENDPTSMDYSP